MDRRLELQAKLESILGARNVYFQPPASIRMVYPCIIYERDQVNTRFADNSPYRLNKRYNVTVIDSDPDSPIPDKIASLPTCIFSRHFTADHLHHDSYTLYF